ncbi:MAG: hypothetical protein HQL43_15915 [Alphaproteobacteria bacterium]|nr:hypothetical protein [Alphaproteobacteria bacterium]
MIGALTGFGGSSAYVTAMPRLRPDQGQGEGAVPPAKSPSQAGTAASSPSQLSDEQQRIVDKLKLREAEVRAHEQAHKAAGGPYAGSPSYTTTQGPDGRRYITGGEVSIDIGPVDGDPEATQRKMEQIKRAALAPSDPSSQDRAVAMQAEAIKAQAETEENDQRQAQLEASGGAGFPLSESYNQATKAYRAASSIYSETQGVGVIA